MSEIVFEKKNAGKIAIVNDLKDFATNEKVAQIVKIDDVFIVEFVTEKMDKSMTEKTDIETPFDDVDSRLDDYLKVDLNKDPFGFGFDGKTLGDIWHAPGGYEWFRKAHEQMKNPFIKPKVDYIWKVMQENA